MNEQHQHNGQRDPFSKAKDEFLLAVIRDGDIGEAGIRLAVALIVKFASREKFEGTGELVAWPSQRLLSDTVQMHRARVDRATKALEQAGLLLVLRPEKPGPGKHNLYTMVMPTGLTGRATSKGSRHGRAENLKKKTGPMDEASSEHNWSHNYVASSKGGTGPMDRASSKPGLAPSVGPELASRVGPNSLEEPFDGAGAHTRPAPISDARCVSVQKNMLAQVRDDETRGLPALEAPAPASHERASEGAPGPNLHIDGDVDLFLNDDNHEFLRHLKRAECELVTLHGAAEIEIQRHLNDALDGLPGGDSTAADRFRRDLWHLLHEVHHSRRDAVFREHLDIVKSFLAQAIGGMRYADDAINVFIQDMWGGVSNG